MLLTKLSLYVSCTILQWTPRILQPFDHTNYFKNNKSQEITIKFLHVFLNLLFQHLEYPINLLVFQVQLLLHDLFNKKKYLNPHHCSINLNKIP